MSWRVDGRGREYHDWDEYQAAIRESQLAQVRAERDALGEDARRHRVRIRAVEGRLAEARGNAEQMARLNRELQSDLGELRQIQGAMQAAQERFERQAADAFQDLRTQAVAAREDLAALDRAQQEHAAEVRGQFDQARKELSDGLREAEERRQAAEAQLRAEITEVDRKLEADKSERLAKARSDGERAAGLAAYTAERLTLLVPRQDELGMRETLTRIGTRLAEVAELVARDTALALGVANTAFFPAQWDPKLGIHVT